MAWISYPSPKVETELGPVTLAFTNGGHVSVQTNAHVNDDKPTIAYRGTEYLINVHLYAAHGWGEKPGPDGYSSITKRADWGKPAPKTHRAAIVAAMTAAVLAYLEAHPDTLRAAEHADANNAADSAAETVGKLSDELEAAREILRAELARMDANAPKD